MKMSILLCKFNFAILINPSKEIGEREKAELPYISKTESGSLIAPLLPPPCFAKFKTQEP